MVKMKLLRQGANLFSRSTQPDLRGAEITTVARDKITVGTLNFIAAPNPLSHDQALDYFSAPEEDLWKRHISVAGSRSERPENPYHAGAATSQPTYDSDTPPLTPDNSCASSPSSSQEDITLSSTLDLRPQYLKLPYLTIPQVYVKNMLKSGKGLACWKPAPLQRPHATRRALTAPGDVGTFSAEGGFKKIFNIWDDASALQLSANRFSHRLTRLPPRNVIVEEDISRGNTIPIGTSSKTIYCPSDNGKITSFEFRRRSQSGAILAATSSVDSEQLEYQADLREWIMQHAELIYKHASKGGRIENNEALYILTGCTKSDSWALAAFEHTDEPSYNNDLMRLEDVTRSGDGQPKYGWTETWSSSVARSGSSKEPGLKDQTLFVRGFKLDFSNAFRNRMESILYPPSHDSPNTGFSDSAGPSNPEGHEGPSGSDGSRQGGDGGQHSSGTSNSSRFGGGGGATSQGYSHNTEHRSTGRSPYGHHLSLSAFPDSPIDSCHPSDDINKHLLDVTGADLAICHDDEWRFALEGLDTPDDLLRSVVDGSKIVTRHGVASLQPNVELPATAGGALGLEIPSLQQPSAESPEPPTFRVGSPSAAQPREDPGPQMTQPPAEGPDHLLQPYYMQSILKPQEGPSCQTPQPDTCLLESIQGGTVPRDLGKYTGCFSLNTLSSMGDLEVGEQDSTIPQAHLWGMPKSGKGVWCRGPQSQWKPNVGRWGTLPRDVGTPSAERAFKNVFNLGDNEGMFQDTSKTLGGEVLKNVDEENIKATLLSSRMVCSSWSQTSLERLFGTSIAFNDWNDIRSFLALTSAPAGTFPAHVKTKHLALNNLTALDDEATAALQGLMSAVTTEESLAMHVPTSGIAGILAQVSRGWTHIRQLTLSGETHPPATFFDQLASFAQLHSLTLEDFQLQRVQSIGDAPAVQFRFPDTITKLSLARSSSLWTFFRTHVLPAHGFAKIGELSIEAQFSFQEKGICDMVRCFKVLQGVHTLSIHAIYDPRCRGLVRDMENIFQSRQLRSAAIRGLRRLYLGFGEMPAHFVFGCIIMHAVRLPFTQIDAIVEFEVPRALGLWDNQDPQSLICRLLSETQSDTQMAEFTRALLVHGCEDALPPAVIETSGRATVCGYPVVFMGLGGEEGSAM